MCRPQAGINSGATGPKHNSGERGWGGGETAHLGLDWIRAIEAEAAVRARCGVHAWLAGKARQVGSGREGPNFVCTLFSS